MNVLAFAVDAVVGVYEAEEEELHSHSPSHVVQVPVPVQEGDHTVAVATEEDDHSRPYQVVVAWDLDDHVVLHDHDHEDEAADDAASAAVGHCPQWPNTVHHCPLDHQMQIEMPRLRS